MEVEVSETVETIKMNGGRLYLLGNYQYVFVRDYKSGAQYLRCSRYKLEKCKAGITIKDAKLTKINKPHTCEQNYEKNLLLKEKAKLKKTVINTDLPIPQIYKNALCEMQDKGLDFVTTMPKFPNLKTGLYKARNNAIGTTKTVFRCFEEVEIPEVHKKNILCEFDDGDRRMLVFCSNRAQDLIKKTGEFFVDGTFQCCPPPFYQLLTIHGDFGSTEDTVHTKPLIYVLMPDKKQTTYTNLFELLKIKLPDLKIEQIHCDFEVALCNAITQVFPDVSVRGCYYHWNRNMWKKAKLLKHKSKRERRIVGLCAILPLLSEDWIQEGWSYIKKEYADSGLKMLPFMTYVGKLLTNRNTLKILSVFGLRHRTNNILEAFHSKLNKQLNKNVTLARLLNVLAKNENFGAMQAATKRGKHDPCTDGAIRAILLQFMDGDIELGHAMEKLR